jgi:hypothetical protein
MTGHRARNATAIVLMGVVLAGVVPMAGAPDARAAPAVVDGRTLELPAPDGYCPIDRDRTPDSAAWEAMRGLLEPQNRLVAWFVPCDALPRWRAEPANGFERHAMVLAPAAPPAAPSRAAYLAAIAADFARSRGVLDDDGDAARRLRERADVATGPTSLQLLERRDDAVLATMVQDIADARGRHRVLGVIGFTAVAGAPLSVNFYAPDRGAEPLQPLRESATAYLARLIAANPEPRGGLAWPIAGAIALAAALAAGAVVLWRRRRA